MAVPVLDPWLVPATHAVLRIGLRQQNRRAAAFPPPLWAAGFTQNVPSEPPSPLAGEGGRRSRPDEGSRRKPRLWPRQFSCLHLRAKKFCAGARKAGARAPDPSSGVASQRHLPPQGGEGSQRPSSEGPRLAGLARPAIPAFPHKSPQGGKQNAANLSDAGPVWTSQELPPQPATAPLSRRAGP